MFGLEGFTIAKFIITIIAMIGISALFSIFGRGGGGNSGQRTVSGLSITLTRQLNTKGFDRRLKNKPLRRHANHD
jgi:hypothetical protein